MSQIIAVGDVNVDLISHFPSYPAKGQDALATSTAVHCGGSAANTAIALSQMGFEVLLISRVGSDPLAAKAVERLEGAGVALTGLQRDPVAMTGLMYIVVTPDGERTILGHRGANMLTDPAQIPQEDVQQAELLHLSGYALLSEPQRSAALFTLATARTHGVSVTLDPGMSLPRDALNELRTLLPVLDVLMPNHIEAQRLTGATSPTHCAERLLEAGVAAVALKLGRDGCLIGDAEGLTYIPAFAVDACDSTGAGDAFAAGIIAGCVGDLSWPSVGTLGNALGAMAASRVGADMPVPTAQELLELLYRYADRELPEPIEHAAQETMTFVERLMRRPEEEGKRWWK